MFGIDAQGVYPIAPTPFTDTGAVDTASTDRMVDWYREIGATGMTILGIMGEAPKLDQSEALAFALGVAWFLVGAWVFARACRRARDEGKILQSGE